MEGLAGFDARFSQSTLCARVSPNFEDVIPNASKYHMNKALYYASVAPSSNGNHYRYIHYRNAVFISTNCLFTFRQFCLFSFSYFFFFSAIFLLELTAQGNTLRGNALELDYDSETFCKIKQNVFV